MPTFNVAILTRVKLSNMRKRFKKIPGLVYARTSLDQSTWTSSTPMSPQVDTDISKTSHLELHYHLGYSKGAI